MYEYYDALLPEYSLHSLIPAEINPIVKNGISSFYMFDKTVGYFFAVAVGIRLSYFCPPITRLSMSMSYALEYI